MKRKLKEPGRDESGQALLLVVILLLVGTLIVVSLLGFMGTGLIAGQVFEKRMAELYAADAGIEDAIWKIKTKAAGLPQDEGDPPLGYSIDPVNGKEFVDEDPSEYPHPIVITYIDEATYRIESTATSTVIGSSTTIVSYLSILDFTSFIHNAITSTGTVGLQPGSTVNDGDVVYCEGDPPSEDQVVGGEIINECVVGWPEAGGLSAFYKSQVDPSDPYPDATLDLDGVDASIGPEYIEGEFDIYNSDNTEATLTLTGTLYITGKTLLGGPKEWTLDLNGNTIFVESDLTGGGASGTALWFEGNCTLIGPGAIVVVGDINFQPNMEGEDFIFVMSVEGTTNFQPQGDFTGSIAGNVEVNLQPWSTITWTEPPPDLNLPGGDDSINVIAAILTWESSVQ